MVLSVVGHDFNASKFVAHICEQPPVRLPGTAAFLTSSTAGVPLPLTHHLKHIYALHERVLLVTVLHELPVGVTRVVLHVGFAEMPSVPEGVRYAQEQAELDCGNVSEVSYYIGRETVIPTTLPGMWMWREAIYAFMQRNAERSAAYFCIPAAQVVEIGIEIEI
jgi:KUP system potassium uptake protein